MYIFFKITFNSVLTICVSYRR